MRMRVALAPLLVCLAMPGDAALTRTAPAAEIAADPNAPAEFVITNQVLRPRKKVPPLGANNWGGCGAVASARR